MTFSPLTEKVIPLRRRSCTQLTTSGRIWMHLRLPLLLVLTLALHLTLFLTLCFFVVLKCLIKYVVLYSPGLNLIFRIGPSLFFLKTFALLNFLLNLEFPKALYLVLYFSVFILHLCLTFSPTMD